MTLLLVTFIYLLCSNYQIESIIRTDVVYIFLHYLGSFEYKLVNRKNDQKLIQSI